MKYMSSNEIRNTWLNFFKDKGHMIEPGASLIPNNDPTLLWINAGVAALKKYFDGSETPNSPRICNVQKCLRTNDIENVGMTSRHHTFFEMLGNFSIGDYFRTDAVTWGFEILTSEKYFAIPLEKLYFTVHPSDKETKELWMNLGVSEEHIIPLEGNFWEIGEGPCGPDTEIFFDRGEKYDPDHLEIKLLKEDIENDRYIEIWNIVFSQFNSKPGLKRENYPELPHKNIDTGGGLERFACILQGAETNFGTDLFVPMIKETEKFAKIKYSEESKMAYHVIADHIRTCTFALADGAMFSNEGRGYVLRRILRRAARYGKKLGIEGSFLYKLVDTVVEVMHEFYPYLDKRKEQVIKFIKLEEEKFDKTLATGENILLEKLAKTSGELSGSDAFLLYDTYGFPFELTVEIAQEKSIKVNEEEFKEEMKKQKERARSSRIKANSMHNQSADLMDYTGKSTFHYEMDDIKTKIIALFKDGVKVDEICGEGEIILEDTNFYAESGGEVADTGFIETNEGNVVVENVIKAPNKQHLHSVDSQGIVLKEGTVVTTHIDTNKRIAIQKNHSAVHLLQKVLQETLGDHVAQAGSYVDEERLRFDFTHFEKIQAQALKEIERKVNEAIAKGLKNTISYQSIEEAKKSGAMALFSEKYGDIVRVVNFDNYSIELCGGCHVSNSSEIGMFVINLEESISSGVRRIEAVTGLNAYKEMQKKQDYLKEVASLLDVNNVLDIKSKLASMIDRFNELSKQLEDIKNNAANTKSKQFLNDIKEINGNAVLIKVLDKEEKDIPLKIVDLIKERYQSYLVYLVNKQDDRLSLLCAVSNNLLNNGYHAGKIIQETSKIVNGGGGGSPFLAQAGGKDITKVDELINKVKELFKCEF